MKMAIPITRNVAFCISIVFGTLYGLEISLNKYGPGDEETGLRRIVANQDMVVFRSRLDYTDDPMAKFVYFQIFKPSDQEYNYLCHIDLRTQCGKGESSDMCSCTIITEHVVEINISIKASVSLNGASLRGTVIRSHDNKKFVSEEQVFPEMYDTQDFLTIKVTLQILCVFVLTVGIVYASRWLSGSTSGIIVVIKRIVYTLLRLFLAKTKGVYMQMLEKMNKKQTDDHLQMEYQIEAKMKKLSEEQTTDRLLWETKMDQMLEKLVKEQTDDHLQSEMKLEQMFEKMYQKQTDDHLQLEYQIEAKMKKLSEEQTTDRLLWEKKMEQMYEKLSKKQTDDHMQSEKKRDQMLEKLVEKLTDDHLQLESEISVKMDILEHEQREQRYIWEYQIEAKRKKLSEEQTTDRLLWEKKMEQMFEKLSEKQTDDHMQSKRILETFEHELREQRHCLQKGLEEHGEMHIMMRHLEDEQRHLLEQLKRQHEMMETFSSKKKKDRWF